MLTLGTLLLAAPREAESELHRLLGSLDALLQGVSELEEQQRTPADFEAEARKPMTAAEVDAYANRVAAEAQAELLAEQQLERERVIVEVGTAIVTGGASVPGQLASSAVGGVTKPIGNAIYAAKKTVIGSTKYNLLKVANTALYFAINLEKDHGGIPPENKMALVTRLATLSTSSKGRGLSSISALASFEREQSPEPPVEHERSPEPPVEHEPSPEAPVEHEPSSEAPVDDQLERGLMSAASNMVGKAEDKAANFFGFGPAKKAKKKKKRSTKTAEKPGSKPGSTSSSKQSTGSKRPSKPERKKQLSNNSITNRVSSYARKQARDLKDKVNNAGAVVTGAANSAGNAMSNAASSAGRAVSNTGKAVRNAAGELGKGVVKVASGTGKVLGAVGGAVGNAVGGVVGAVGGALGGIGGGGASGDGGAAPGCECNQPERKPDDLGYKMSSTLLGNTRQQLMKIAYNAITVAMLTTDEDTGIPFENKAMLTAKVAMLRTDENVRSLFTLASDPMMAGGFALLMNG